MLPSNGVAFGKDNTETNFAWAVYAGLSYKVTPGVTIDLSYRYTGYRRCQQRRPHQLP